MVKREITPGQANTLIEYLEELDPQIKYSIGFHKSHMNQRVGCNVGLQVAKINYLQYHLDDFLEGVAAAYFEFVPADGEVAPVAKEGESHSCTKLNPSIYYKKQIEEIRKEIDTNKHYLGEKFRKNPTKEEADWAKELSFLFGIGFGYGVCYIGCPNRENCKDKEAKLERALRERDEIINS